MTGPTEAGAAAGPRGSRCGRVSRLLARDRAVDPVVLVATTGAIAVLAATLWAFHVPPSRSQPVTAAAVVLFFLGSVLLSARNGLVLLFVLPGVFNGEDFRPYFWLWELLVYLTLARGFAGHLVAGRRLRFPYAPFFLLVLASAVVSLPLNARELWLELQVFSWREILEELRRADRQANLFYVRAVLDVASGIGICVLTVNRSWPKPLLLRLAAAATLVYLGVTVVGLGFHWLSPPTWRTFLTLFLTGPYTGGFVGVGSNVSFFAQYAVAYLPLVVLVAVEPTRPWRQWLAVLGLLASAYTLPATYQRGAYLAFLLELALLAAAGITLVRGRTWHRVGRAAVAAALAVTVLAVALLLLTPMGSSAKARFAQLWHDRGEAVRIQTVRITGEMLRDQPLLGVGTGRFARFFPLYARPTDQASNAFTHEPGWSTHNLYAQLLAEQGVVGLASFLALLAAVLIPVLRVHRRLGAERPVVLLLLVSLAVWLAYGLLYYTFLMRSMQLYFWIALGLLVTLTAPAAPAVRVPRRVLWVAAALLVLVAGARVYAVVERPLPPDLADRLHREWEYWADPAGARWTRGSAVLTSRVAGPSMRLAIGFPVAHLAPRPQKVTVLVDGTRVGALTLDTPPWRVLDVPVAKPIGSLVVVQLRVAYTVTPVELGLGADPRRLGVMVKPIAWLGDDEAYRDPTLPPPAGS